MAVQAGILVQVEPINGKSKIENRDNTLNGMKNQVSHVWSSFLFSFLSNTQENSAFLY